MRRSGPATIPIHSCAGPFRRCRKPSSIWRIPATRIEIADDSGLPGKRLVEHSGTDEIGKIYEQNRQDALAADVFGSPAYVLDGEVFWGQDRIELLVDALKSGRGPYRSQA